MHKFLLTGAFCLAMYGASAQPWMSRFEGKERVKLQDIVDAHEAATKGQTSEESERTSAGKEVREGKDHHFDRWRWYWEQHLDAEGYIVSPLKNYQEWEAYKKRLAAAGARSKTTANSSDWSFQGPASSPANGKGLGRIQKVTFHPTDPNIFWVGTAGGGAWMTANSGLSWTSMTDMLPVMGVADITYNPLNPSVIYLCTGDRDGYDNSSIGVLKTTDGGINWSSTGFQFPISMAGRTNALLVNPLDTAALLLTTSTGIYQSRDGGASWAQRTSGAFRELYYRPGDTAVVYATSSSISNSQIFRSANGGLTWTQVSNITGNPSRISIAVSPAAPNMVKAIVANAAPNYGLEGIYHSSDTGKTFTKIFNPISCSQNYLANNPNPTSSNCDGQGSYDLTIAVSPLDSTKVVIGGINTWYSANGGATWQIANQWTGYISGLKVVHADKHFMAWQPTRPTIFFEGNDGGLFTTGNILGTVWTDLTNGMGITQFYRMSVANHSLSALGGAQDNGSKRIIPGSATEELTGGDGMNCELDPTDPNVFYTSYQYGTVIRTIITPPSSTQISNSIPGRPSGAWVTPYALHPRDGSRIVAGYDKVYLSFDQGSTWTAISPVFSAQRINRVAFAMSDVNTIYALASNLVRVTLDNGTTWTPILGMPGGTVSDIMVDPKNKEHFWITYSGYTGSKVAEYDPVNGWQTLNDSLPSIPVNCITMDTSNRTLYIGTDAAVFYRDKNMNHWALWNDNLPAAEVTDMGINYSTGELWASTFGRGLWKTPKYELDPAPNGISIIPFAADVIRISPNPSTGSFDIQTTNEGLAGQGATVTILDLAGRNVWTGASGFSSAGLLHIDAGALQRAHYIVDVIANNGMRAKARLVVY